MDPMYYWELFMATGAPAYYLAYQSTKRTEDKDVSQNTRTCAPPNGVQ